MPENPADAGFGDGSNIVISLTPNNQTIDDDNSTSVNDDLKDQPRSNPSVELNNFAAQQQSIPVAFTLLLLITPPLLMRFVS